MSNGSFIALNQKSFHQRKFWNRCTGTKVPKWQSGYFLPNCHFGTFFPVHRFQKVFGKMTSGWVLWKSYYTHLLKNCLRPCPGLSMYLSERMNWTISSFHQWISKILFVLGSWDHFGSLGFRIGECPFFCVSILLLGSVFYLGGPLPQCFFQVVNSKKMGTLQFYIPCFKNDPSYPKQKEFSKSTKRNLKWFNLSS